MHLFLGNLQKRVKYFLVLLQKVIGSYLYPFDHFTGSILEFLAMQIMFCNTNGTTKN